MGSREPPVRAEVGCWRLSCGSVVGLLLLGDVEPRRGQLLLELDAAERGGGGGKGEASERASWRCLSGGGGGERDARRRLADGFYGEAGAPVPRGADGWKREPAEIHAPRPNKSLAAAAAAGAGPRAQGAEGSAHGRTGGSRAC